MPATETAINSEQLRTLLISIGTPVRWNILKELLKGEPLPVFEIARRVGITPSNAAKVMQQLARAQIVEKPLAGGYRIVARYVVPGENALNLGPMVINLDQVAF